MVNIYLKRFGDYMVD